MKRLKADKEISKMSTFELAHHSCDVQGKIQDQYEIGQLVFGVEYDGDHLDEAEVSGYLFLAECGDYLICAPDYVHCNGDIKRQLREMYNDSLNNYGVEIHMLHKDLTFTTCEEAEAVLKELTNGAES